MIIPRDVDSWQSGDFLYQISAVQIQSSALLITVFIYSIEKITYLDGTNVVKITTTHRPSITFLVKGGDRYYVTK